MTTRRYVSTLTLIAALSASLPGVAHAQAPQTGTLRVVVKDPSGAVVPGAMVQIRGAEDRTATIVRSDITSDGQGIATATDLKRDRYFQGRGLVDLMRAIQSV